MTPTLTRAPAGLRHGPVAGRWSLTRGCQVLPDVAVAVLASWTFVYHGCLLLRLAVPTAVVLELCALTVLAGLAWRTGRRRSPDTAATDTAGTDSPDDRQVPPPAEPTGSGARRSTVTLVAAPTAAFALATGLLFAVNASWPVISALWLAAALTGTAWAVLAPHLPPVLDPGADGAAADGAATETSTPPGDEAVLRRVLGRAFLSSRSSASTVVAVVWATLLAALSMFTLWPNPDDLYYVNLGQWIVDHGTYPLRDTIFSDLVYPMSSWPPIASYDALVGTVARLGHVHAATVAYMVVPPLATFLSVLALWRLLREWQVRALGLTLSLALAFLLLDGGFGYASPGNLFLIRLWQGKVILLCVLLPTLLVYALRYVDRPTWARAGWLFAGGVAAVGLSTTAMFLVPLLAVGGAAPLVRHRPLLALRGFAAMAAYPIVTGAITKAVGGRSADLFGSRELYRFEPAWFGHQIFRDGLPALITVVAVLLGALLIPRAEARITTGVLTTITGVTFIPGFTHLSFDLVGLGPTLWRVSWVASIAALVGVLASQTVLRWSRPRLQVIGPVILLAAFGVYGTAIWTAGNGVSLVPPPHWQRGHQSIAAAAQAIAHLQPGDVVLTPEDLAVTIDVMTTRVKTVAPRDYFMDYLRDDPSFHYGLRLNLIHFANREGHPTGPQVTKALRVLDVDEVCLRRIAYQRLLFLRGIGYQPVDSAPLYSCVMR
jgi:hypothetical protein